MPYVADESALRLLVPRREVTPKPQVEEAVAKIISQVKARGDDALLHYTKVFDGFEWSSPSDLRVPLVDLQVALRDLDEGFKEALTLAADNIRAFHRLQVPEKVVWDQPGKEVKLRLDPLARAALYVPGGMAAYPSSVLMNAIPAQVAGVKEIAVFTPPARDRSHLQAVYAACALLGITEVYAVGGAQALAAAAYGTQTIKACQILTGPGNQYVTEAKRQLMSKVRIDMLAGPSELLIVADQAASPDFIAADLLAQGEHDPLAGLYLVLIGPKTQTSTLERRIRAALLDQLEIQPSPNAALSLENLKIFCCPDLSLAAAISNTIAPEHLSLQFQGAALVTDRFTAAGSIFVGPYTPEAVCDYACGVNHVLPTDGTARFTSGLGVQNFLKATQIVSYTKEGLARDGLASMVLAYREGLPYHGKSLALRLGDALRLDANENPQSYLLDSPLSLSLLKDLSRTYPSDDYKALGAALLEALDAIFPQKAYGFSLSRDNLVLGNGSDEILDLLLRGLMKVDRGVAILEPSFSEYPRLLAANHLRPVVFRPSVDERAMGLPKDAIRTPGWFDQDLLLNALKSAASDGTIGAVLLCNPNNPTGQRFDAPFIEGLIEGLPKDCLLILDEAYMDFEPQDDQVAWYPHHYPQVIQVRTLSKAFGLAGLRLGYALMAPEHKEKLMPLLAPYRISSASEALGIASLKALVSPEGKAAFYRQRSAIISGRDQLVTALGLDPSPQRSGNFLWASLKPMALEALAQRNLKVRRFGGNWRNQVRITIGNTLQMSLVTSALQGRSL